MAVNFFWFGGFFSAYFVGKVLVIANGKPRLVAVKYWLSGLNAAVLCVFRLFALLHGL